MTAADRPAPPAAPLAVPPAARTAPWPDAPAAPRPATHGAPAHPWPGAPAAPPVSRWQRLATPAGVLAAVAGAFAYVGAVDPNHPGHYPVCPLYRISGLYCPGCGGLRSAHAFVHGDLVAALHDNAPAVAAYFAFAVLWVVWAVRAWRGRPARLALGPAQMWAIGALLLVFSVVRNLPFGGWLHP
ncbi:DUF2752 domain-containing protein [Streptomyces sp. NPDC048106]|uniref:DUF2752 domain-containing protein n=1 Tax=Streptomyces sp. NPDC048106 TaxID=3155750 RepID=UPI003455B47C